MRRILTALASAVLALTPAVLVPTGAAAAAQAGLSFTASSAVRLPGNFSVRLTGTYTCGPFAAGVPDRGVVDLTVSQTTSAGTINGYGYLDPAACDGAAHPYAVEVTTFGEQAYRRGPGQWSGSGYVEGDGGMQHGYVSPTPIWIR
jgi:hypothetical protein